MLAVDAVHLRDMFNRQRHRLNLRLLKSHELGAESCSLLVWKFQIVGEYLVGTLAPPFVLAHVQIYWSATHGIILDGDMIRIASCNYVRIAVILVGKFLLLVKPLSYDCSVFSNLTISNSSSRPSGKNCQNASLVFMMQI